MTSENPDDIHELYRECGALNRIDFCRVGTNDIFTHDLVSSQSIRRNENESDDKSSLSSESELIINCDLSGLSDIQRVTGMPFDIFRSKIVDHFDTMLSQNKIQWTKMHKTIKSL